MVLFLKLDYLNVDANDGVSSRNYPCEIFKSLVVLGNTLKITVFGNEEETRSKSRCTELVGHKIARLNHKSFFY